jgi:hypothetical protein
MSASSRTEIVSDFITSRRPGSRLRSTPESTAPIRNAFVAIDVPAPLRSMSLDPRESVGAPVLAVDAVVEFLYARFGARNKMTALADTPWSPGRSTWSTACAKSGSRKTQHGPFRRTADIPDIGHAR